MAFSILYGYLFLVAGGPEQGTTASTLATVHCSCPTSRQLSGVTKARKEIQDQNPQEICTTHCGTGGGVFWYLYFHSGVFVSSVILLVLSWKGFRGETASTALQQLLLKSCENTVYCKTTICQSRELPNLFCVIYTQEYNPR